VLGHLFQILQNEWSSDSLKKDVDSNSSEAFVGYDSASWYTKEGNDEETMEWRSLLEYVKTVSI
jgi:hypothetical protein